MAYSGMLVIVVSTAGSGKGVLIKHIKQKHPEVSYPNTITTREKRSGEVDGDHYSFLTKEKFEHHIERGDFIEWTSIDGGNLYGTFKTDVYNALKSGKVAVKEIEITGFRQVEEALPKENFVTIYIDAGEWNVLARRIKGRASISDEELESRRKRFEYERHFKREATFVVNNPDGKLKEAEHTFEEIIQTLLARVAAASCAADAPVTGSAEA